VLDRRNREQARGIERGQGTILGTNQQRNFGAAKNYRIASLRLQSRDYLVVPEPGPFREFTVHKFIPNRIIDDLLVFG
jgi:hypothetical protein